MVQKKLSLLGEVCPFSLLKTQSELEQMNFRDTLLIDTDFNQSVRNIIKWCDYEGYKFELDELDHGIWQIKIEKR